MTQPVLWGHAFINPKDIPLLSLLLLSVYLGLRMHDSLFERGAGSFWESFSQAWRDLTPRTRLLLLIATTVWLVLIAVLFGGTPLIHGWIDNAVRDAANGETSLITQIAPRIQRVAPEIYVEKFFVFFLRIRAISLLIVTAIVISLYHHHLPIALRTLGRILPAGMI